MPKWDPVEVESTDRAVVLPDGRRMQESRITISREMMERMWQGYVCAACLEDVSELGPFPVRCPNGWCGFEIRKLQRAQLERDFVGEIEEMRADGWIDRERAKLEEEFFIPKSQVAFLKGVRPKH